jgi:hypothetical protein
MKCDSQAHSWLAPLQALALIASPMLRLQHYRNKYENLKKKKFNQDEEDMMDLD